MSFEEYVQNEFSSRVLEKLASTSCTYRALGIRMFCRSWDTLILSLPAVMFMCSCLRTITEKSCFDLVMKNLWRHPEYLFTSKKYKRILVVFAEVCNFDNLQLLCHKMMEQRQLYELLDDRLLAQVISVMLKKRLVQMLDLLREQVTYKIHILIETSHFLQLLLNLVEQDAAIDQQTRSAASLHIRQFMDIKHRLERRGQCLCPQAIQMLRLLALDYLIGMQLSAARPSPAIML
jgi:hypothetical protein